MSKKSIAKNTRDERRSLEVAAFGTSADPEIEVVVGKGAPRRLSRMLEEKASAGGTVASFDDFSAFQARVASWVTGTFGEASLQDRRERARRVLEEAVELVQAAGLPKVDASQILKDVYSREPGSVFQEVGGVMNTISAFCAGLDVDLAHASEAEMIRVEDPKIVGKCRRKNADKAARGLSDCGIRHNTILFGDTIYHVTQAYAEGVIACRGGVTRFDASPYPGRDQRAGEWLNGFSNAEQWDHILEDGTDALDLFPDGREIEAPEPDYMTRLES